VSDAAGNALVGFTATVDFFVLAGDVNRDRMVNSTDFALLAQNFGRTGRTYGQGDLSGDGAVNGRDFALLAQNFGRRVPAVQAAQASAVAAPAPAAPAPAAPGETTTPAARRVVRRTTPAPKKSAAAPARPRIVSPAVRRMESLR
jgi:hypothetical protein